MHNSMDLLIEAVCRVKNIDPDQVSTKTPIEDLMMDSLDLVDLVFFLQREFGLEARMEDYREIRSLDGLVKFVSSHAPGGRAPEASPGIA